MLNTGGVPPSLHRLQQICGDEELKELLSADLIPQIFKEKSPFI